MVADIPGIEDLEVIGRGGFSTVYVGTQPALSRRVAVKVLTLHVASDEEAARFERECQAHGSLANHPNIVTMLGAGLTDDDVPYLVLDHLAGGSLADRLTEGPVPLATALAVGVQIAGALEYAHRAGVVHRDVKPANVLFDEFGRPVLGDFGISQMQGAFETRSGQMSASVAYAAPEVFAGGSGSPSGDVYSLAATVFAALAGTPAFYVAGDDNLLALMVRVSSEPPPDLRAHGVPDQVASVVEQGMAKAPEVRFASAAAFGAALADAAAAVGIDVPPMVERAEAARPPTFAAPTGTQTTRSAGGTDDVPTHRVTQRNQRAGPLVAAAAVVAALAVGAGLLWPRSDDSGTDTAGTSSSTTPTTFAADDDDVVLVSDPIDLVDGVTATRTAILGAPDGDEARVQIEVANPNDETYAVDHIEVVPKSLAASAADIEVLSDGVEVLEDDPVLGWTTEVAAGGSAVLAYTVPVEPGRADAARLDAWDADRREAEVAYLDAHPDRWGLTLAGPVSAGDPSEVALGPPGTDDGGDAGSGGGSDGDSGAGGGGSGDGSSGTTVATTSPTTRRPATTGTTATTRVVTTPSAPRSVVAADPIPSAAEPCFGKPDEVAVTLRWSAPTDDGGGSITGYTIRAELTARSGGVVRTMSYSSGADTAEQIVVPRYEDDAYWRYTVRARNSAGEGPTALAQATMPAVTSYNTYRLYPVMRAVGLQVSTTFQGAPDQCQPVRGQPEAAGTILAPGTNVTVPIAPAS